MKESVKTGQNKKTFMNCQGKIKSRSDEEVKNIMRKTVRSLLIFAAAYLCGRAKFLFDTYPFGVALLCVSGSRGTIKDRLWGVIPAFLGLLFSVIGGIVPVFYLAAYFSVAVLRVILMFAEKQKKKKYMARDDEGLLSVVHNENESEVETSITGEGKRNAVLLFFGVDSTQKNSIPDSWLLFVSAASGSFISGCIALILNGFEYYNLYGLLTLLAMSLISVAVFMGFDNESDKNSLKKNIAMLSLMAICTFASSGVSLFGIRLSPMLSVLLPLFVCAEKGIPAGLLTGLFCGAAFNLWYLPVTLLSPVIYKLISSLKKSAALAFVCALEVAWCFYFGGAEGLLTVLPSMLLAIPVFLVTEKYREHMYPVRVGLREKDNEAGVYFAQAISEKTINDETKRKLNALSEAFGNLSENFYRLSDRFRRPDLLGLRKITDDSFNKNCDGCRNYDVCWGAGYSETLEAVRCIASALHTKGAAQNEDLPEEFRRTCMRSDKITEDVNKFCSDTTENIIRSSKIGRFAADYEGIKEILKDALECDGTEYECNMEAADKIYEYLMSLDINVKGVVVYGKRCCHITVKGIGLGDGADCTTVGQICKRVSEIVGVVLSGPVFEVSDDGTYMLFCAKPKLSALCSHKSISALTDKETKEIYLNPFTEKGDREVCGDITDAFVTENSYFYSLISDGMGSGPEAAFTSGVCSMFIEKMLLAGNRSDITLRMLNNIIRSGNIGCDSECSATVDLMELDLMNGTASFIKSGAAPTYILRQESVYKVSAASMPMGIIKSPDIRITKFDTQPGDVIVMISDGCCPDSDECRWLVSYLNSIRIPDMSADETGQESLLSFCDKVRDEILTLAQKNIPDSRMMDDMSCSVVMVTT